MARYFNTSGVCDPARHYMIAAAPRLPGARALIDRGEYFVVHAPRQTGKTTTLRAIVAELAAEGRYAALHVSCETARPFSIDIDSANAEVWAATTHAARHSLSPDLRPEGGPRPWADRPRFSEALEHWARSCPRPIVLFLDEIDALTGPALLSILSQIRSIHPLRPAAAPWSVVLCGMRDVRDYKAAAGGDPDRLGSASPFNIKAETFRLGDFSEAELRALYAQHSGESGQKWSEGALRDAWDLSQGQPWLTNALAAEVIDKMGVRTTIEEQHVHRARERLIQSRATHLDSLVARLDEERVRRVLGPIVAGGELGDIAFDDDVGYLRDLGLIARDLPVRFANPIYREIVLRLLAARAEARVDTPHPTFVREDGSLDVDAMLLGFASFWRQHGATLRQGQGWPEIASQLVLMGFLDAIVNGTGLIDRDVGIGRGRIDVLVRWPLPDGTWQRAALELKVWRDGRVDPMTDGIAQLDGYLSGLGLDCGTLVIFDQREQWQGGTQEPLWEFATSANGRSVRVLRL